ncbi:isoflavone reductase family protein-like protein CipA [Bimuria novae-zelandiae CBS 107.79]|uniref:Isoflavone reductase family protein-like protein CipA n=1 Tax=Bimuria novae-zelandiae CBS 107.79 TaxID=1447943 RepID=A0A6A5UPE1_9PLEO|nr:isoflavone reductase family protein-like protein CipA [Bimuria novae-zelandiae CBS 107.79]
MSIKNVVIIGAGGNLGPSILKALLNHSSFNVTVLSRKDSDKTFPDKAKVIRVDYDSFDDLKSAFAGQDAIVSNLATSALAIEPKIIDAAIAAGVKRYLPSEFGSNTTDPRLVAAVPVSQGKVSIQDYLKSKSKEISYTNVITGPFFDWGIKVGFLGINGQTKTGTLIDGGKAKFSSTNLSQIGLAVVKILEHAEETKNQDVFVSSFETSQKELLEKAEKITGEKWKVEELSSKALREEGLKKVQAGDFSGVVPLLQAAVSGEEALADHSAYLWNEKLGLPKEDLEESIKAGLSGKLVGE